MGRFTDTKPRHRLSETELIERVTSLAHPLEDGDLSGYDPLLEMIGDKRIVLIGEASHGTHEFYRERALITRRLIEEKDFSFVAIEGDWPEAHRIHRYVQGGTGSAMDAMNVFTVYPTWMWGNVDTLHFVEWLRRFNDARPPGKAKVGFYGLDLYSLFHSMNSVISYLEGVDPTAAQAARARYSCFEPFGGDKDLYAYSAAMKIVEGCEREAVEMLQQLRSDREKLVDLGGEDAYFYAVMAARVARDGERYYRTMYQGNEASWNLRDTHMQDTLDDLLQHFPDSKAVIWEHNTHVGDFRFTADADGMVNVGQLTRERHPGESVAVGFGSYEGSVTASREWGSAPEHMRVPQGIPGSYDNIFHQAGLDRFLLLLEPLRETKDSAGFDEYRGQRAIGVVYHPEYERGNYVPTILAGRYDAYIHIDRTRAVKPLNLHVSDQASVPRWNQETYPTGF